VNVQTKRAKWEQDIIICGEKRTGSSAKWNERKRAPAQISVN